MVRTVSSQNVRHRVRALNVDPRFLPGLCVVDQNCGVNKKPWRYDTKESPSGIPTLINLVSGNPRLPGAF